MAENKTEVVSETTVYEKPGFKEKAADKLQWIKDHKKGVIVGAVVTALGVAAAAVGIKHYNDPDSDVDYESWIDDDGASHTKYLDSSTNENVEVIATPVETTEE